MSTAQSVIRSFMNYLDGTTAKGTTALDAAVASVSNFNSWSKLTSTMVSDCAAYNGDWENFLKDMCGIVLDNDDTGAILGSDAGGGSTKNAEDIVPEYGNLTYPDGTSFTTHGLTVNIPEVSTLSDSRKFIVGALYTWWIDSALTMIEDSYGLSFYNSGVTVTEIDVSFYDKSDGRMAYVEYSSGQKCDTLHLKINMNYYNNIDTTNPNGSASGLITYLDRTIAHEMVHAVMAANVDYFSSLPTIFKEGSAELLHGIDDKRYSNIKKITASSSALSSALRSNSADGYAAGYVLLRYLAKQAAEGRDPAVSVKTEEQTVVETETTVTETTPATTETATTETQTTTTTTETTQTSQTQTSISTTTTTSNTSTSTTTVAPSISTSGKTLTVKGNNEKDVWLGGVNILTGKVSNVYASDSVTTINASAMTGSAILAGNSNNNVITSGSGGATLWGGAGGNDTLTGGSGQDVFWYLAGGGDDVIKNFTSGKGSGSDVLAVSSAISSMNRTLGSLTLTMQDGGSLKVNLGSDVDTAFKYTSEIGTSSHTKVKVGNATSDNVFTYDKNVECYFGGEKNNTLNVSESAEIWLDSGNYSNITELNAANSAGNNILAGDSNSNTIIGGKGTSSLWGGAGSADDVLTGGSGSNMFWYGQNEGNDTIQNAKSADTLNLYNVQLADITSIEKNDSGWNIGILSNTLTIKGDMPTVNLADGSSWTYNNENGSWQQA